jgi:hypothetical protein
MRLNSNDSTRHPSCLGAFIFAIPARTSASYPPPHHLAQRHLTSRTPNCRLTATMGFTDFFTDVWETFAHPSPDAEVQGGSSTKSPASGTDEESGAEAEVNKQDQKKGGDSGEQGHKPSGGDDDDEPEEEEDDEEEPDIKDVLEKRECTITRAGENRVAAASESACERSDGA